MTNHIRQTSSSYHIYPIGQQHQEEDNQFLTVQNHQQPTFPKFTQHLKPNFSKSLDYRNKSTSLHNNKKCKTLQKDHGEQWKKREVLIVKPNQLLLPHLIHQRMHPNLRKNAKQHSHPQSKLQAVIGRNKSSFFQGLSSMKNSRQLKPKRIINIGSLNCSHIFLSQMHSKPPIESNPQSISKKQLRKLIVINRMNPLLAHPFKNQHPAASHSLTMKKQ